MTLEYFKIVALTSVQKILAGSIFNTKMGEKSKCKEKRERFVFFVFSPLPSFFFIALSPTSSTNSRGKACYAGYPREEVYPYLVFS